MRGGALCRGESLRLFDEGGSVRGRGDREDGDDVLPADGIHCRQRLRALRCRRRLPREVVAVPPPGAVSGGGVRGAD